MKKIIALIMLLTMIAGICIFASASDEPVSVYLDGTLIEFDVQPHIINGKTMVPVRAIYEAMGANVVWNESEQMVIASKWNEKINENITVVHIIGSNDMQSSGGDGVYNYDAPAMLIDGRTLVPARAVAEAFDYNVEWDEAEYNVIITSKESDFGNVINIDNYTKYIGKTVDEIRKEIPEKYTDADHDAGEWYAYGDIPNDVWYHFEKDFHKCFRISVPLKLFAPDLADYNDEDVFAEIPVEKLVNYLRKPMTKEFRDEVSWLVFDFGEYTVRINGDSGIWYNSVSALITMDNKSNELIERFINKFGKSLEQVSDEYKDTAKLTVIEYNMGLSWYRLTNSITLGFVDITAAEEHNNGTGGKMVAVKGPVFDFHPDIYEFSETFLEHKDETTHVDYASGCEILSLQEFQKYLQKTVEIDLSKNNEFERPYLSYDYEGIKIFVFCEEDGSIKLNHYDYSTCILRFSE